MSKNLRPSAEDLLSKPFPWEGREDRVVIYPDEMPTMTAAGLHIPEQAIGKPSRGLVVEVGPGSEKFPVKQLNRGDYVIFGRYAGVEVEINDTLYLIVRQSDIMLRDRKG